MQQMQHALTARHAGRTLVPPDDVQHHLPGPDGPEHRDGLRVAEAGQALPINCQYLVTCKKKRIIRYLI